MSEEVTKHPPEPTADDCYAHREFIWDGYRAMAVWYPQMGGYIGKAVAVVDDPTGDLNICVDVYVWHTGELPFSGDDGDAAPPVRLHHCMIEQFEHFGKTVGAFQDRVSESLLRAENASLRDRVKKFEALLGVLDKIGDVGSFGMARIRELESVERKPTEES